MSDIILHRVVIDGQERGPYSISQLRSMWNAGTINRETPHFMDGYDEWLPLSVISEDLEPPVAAPAQAMSAYRPPFPTDPPRRRGIYIIMGLLGGMIGLHNFYAGRLGTGACQALILILTGWLLIPLVPLFIWVVVELFIVDKDGKGKRMT